jgi:hypothetical protein
MARVFGMLADAITGFGAVVVLKNFKRATSAEAKYALTAAGVPEDSNFVTGPKTMSASAELNGTPPIAGTTEVTVGSDTFHLTKVEESYQGDGSAATCDMEGSVKL